ncbi:MAG: cellulase family glycosylhydrolase, partial [Planctomycetota bacterium]
MGSKVSPSLPASTVQWRAETCFLQLLVFRAGQDLHKTMYQMIALWFSIYFGATTPGIPQPDYTPLRVRVHWHQGHRVLRGAFNEKLRGVAVPVYKFRRDQFRNGNPPDAIDFIRDPAYYDMLVERNVNAVRVVFFDPWQRSHGDPGSTTPYPFADLDDPVEVAELLADLDAIVQLCDQRHIYVMINYHDTTGYRDPEYSLPADANGKFAYTTSTDYLDQFWDLVAPRYADSKHVLYELTNEPVGYHPNDYTAADLDAFAALYHRVRTMAPDTHLVLLSFTTPASYGSTMLDVANEMKARRVYFNN